jgi:hypothetical protein
LEILQSFCLGQHGFRSFLQLEATSGKRVPQIKTPVLTLFCRSSRAFSSTFASAMEEIEVDTRVGLATVVGGLLVVEDLAATEWLGLVLVGEFLSPSESEARGRAPTAGLLAAGGETTFRRIVEEGDDVVGGFEPVEEDTVGFEGESADAFSVTEDLLLGVFPDAGAGTPVEEALEMAMGLTGVAEGELEDFFIGEALGVAVFVVPVDALGAVGFTVPVPNVPELIIYKHM